MKPSLIDIAGAIAALAAVVATGYCAVETQTIVPTGLDDWGGSLTNTPFKYPWVGKLTANTSITLVTNLVHGDNAVWERDWAVMWPEGGGPNRMTRPATEQWTTTNITEHTELTVNLSDGPHTFVYDRLLSSVTAVLRLKPQQWEPAGIRTNSTAPGHLTNSLSVWCLTNLLNGTGTWTNIIVQP